MSHGGKGPRIPGANTPASLSAFEAGYALIEENRRKAAEQKPAPAHEHHEFLIRAEGVGDARVRLSAMSKGLIENRGLRYDDADGCMVLRFKVVPRENRE